MTSRLTLVVILMIGGRLCGADLIVNVRNQGGESYKQTIRANLTDETVKLSFKGNDGSRTTLVIDFRNEIQLVHTVRLGDQEENEVLLDEGIGGGGGLNLKRKVNYKSPAVYKSYCFVTKFKQNQFIPVDAMSKLRQKNPWSLRTPERIEPSQNISFDILLDPTATDWISPVIREECGTGEVDGSFVTSTYAVKMEIGERALNPEDFLRAVRDVVVEKEPSPPRGNNESSGNNNESAGGGSEGGGRACGSGGSYNKPCICTATVCIGWYPCSLKFCRARSAANNTTNLAGAVPPAPAAPGAAGGSSTPAGGDIKTYRCGIHTCRICRNYLFGVTSGLECV